MSSPRAIVATLAGIGAVGLLLKAARYSDEAKVMIGPSARAVAEEVHTPHAPAPDAVTAAEVLAERAKEKTGTD